MLTCTTFSRHYLFHRFVESRAAAMQQGTFARIWESSRRLHPLTTHRTATRLLTARRLQAPAVGLAASWGCRGLMLQDEELLRMFEASGAIRRGHFELSSGRHSGTYV